MTVSPWWQQTCRQPDAAAEAAGEQLRAAHPGWWVHAGSLS